MLRPDDPPGKDPDAPGAATTTRPATTPLWAVLSVAWAMSLGTGVAWGGIFFVTEHVFGYTEAQNLVLAGALGLAYALAAFFATSLTGIVTRPRTGPPSPLRSARTVLVLILLVAGLVALVPVLWEGQWTIWVFGFTYVPLTGLLWPTLEQYVSSGRRGRQLNRATGAFNLAWASAVMVAMWAMTLLIEDNARWIIGALAPLHLASLILLIPFSADPQAHGQPAHEHDPDQDRAYRRLLRLARTALFASYVLHASLMPVLPQITERLGLDPAARPALASVWMTTRVVTFAIMQHTIAWHGKRAAIVVGSVLMVIAYAICLAAGTAPALAGALALFGVGVGVVYGAAIYYALEVGTTDIDAGGKHEAMIGFGYSAGPLIALAIRTALPGP